MIREADALLRRKRFLLIRYALIFISGALGFIETRDVSPWPLSIVIGAAVASNLYLGTLSPFLFFDATMQAIILVADTALVSCILLLSRASQEFFFFFFFAMIMAAKIENLALLALAALPISLLTLFLPGSSEGFLSPALMRIPFLLATALFYGYVVLPERTGEMNTFTSAPKPPGARPPQVAG